MPVPARVSPSAPAHVSEILRCPGCHSTGTLAGSPPGSTSPQLWCTRCRERVPVVDGIPDFAPHIPIEVRSESWTQALMNTSFFGWVYETPFWRPLHTQLVSGHGFGEELAEILTLAEDGPEDVVVDLACGTGPYARAFAARSEARVLGIDLSPGMLGRALRHARELDLPRLMFARGDIFSLPIDDATVDHVNCCGALHLFSDPRGIWAEIARILKPGGVFTGMTIGWAPGPFVKVQRNMVARGRGTFFAHDTLASDLEAAGLGELYTVQHRLGFLFRATRAQSGALGQEGG